MKITIPDSVKDHRDIPGIVQYLMAASYLNQGVGSWALEKALSEHPEYFPEVIEHRRKWALIPEEVKTAFFAESSEKEAALYEDCRKLTSGEGGIMHWITREGQEEWIKYSKCTETKRPLLLALKREMHEKYLAKYGIEFEE